MVKIMEQSAWKLFKIVQSFNRTVKYQAKNNEIFLLTKLFFFSRQKKVFNIFYWLFSQN